MGKKLVIVCCMIVGILLAAILLASEVFETLEEDTLAVAVESQVEEQIQKTGDPIPLKELFYGDVIYKALMGYFVGEDRIYLDADFPMYINDTAGIRFWADENWLITTQMEVYQSFHSMYLTEGRTYNPDMTQADDAEFILVTLPNGLYMNAQAAVFRGSLGEHAFPANSILLLEAERLRWYIPMDGMLIFGEEEAVFGATITIGGHTYQYADLIEALGKLKGALDDGKRPDDDDIEDAQDLIKEKDEDSLLEEDAQGDRDNQGGLRDETFAGEQAGARPNKPGVSDGGLDGSDGAGDSSNSGTSGGEADGGNNSGDGAHNPGDGLGGNTNNPGTGTPGTGGNTGNVPGTPEEKPGDDSGSGTMPTVPDQGPSVFEYNEPKLTIVDLETWFYAMGLEFHIDDKDTNIIKNVDFAVYGDITLTGLPATGSVTIGGKTYKTYAADRYDGTQTVFRKFYSSNKLDQVVALATLEPGSTVYLEYSYRYYYRQQQTVIGTDGTETTEVILSRPRYESDLIEITIPDAQNGLVDVEPVKSSWDTSFATHANAMELTDVTLANSKTAEQGGYDPNLVTEDFDTFFTNFKKNVTPYVSNYVFTLTPIGTAPGTSADKVITTNSRTLDISAAINGGADFVSGNVLDPNTGYTYTVAVVDKYGNQIPLIADPSKPWSSTVFTQKATPTVTFTQTQLTDSSGNVDVDRMHLTVTISDPNDALQTDADGNKLPVKFAVTEYGQETRAYLSGTVGTTAGTTTAIDDNTNSTDGPFFIELAAPIGGGSVTYEIILDSLAYNFTYNAEVWGDIYLQPTGGDAYGSLNPQTDVKLGSERFTTARLEDGMVNLQNGIIDLHDTYGTITLTVQQSSTLGLLPMIDEFRIKLSGPDLDYTTAAAREELIMDMDTILDNYSDRTNILEVIPSDPANKVTGIALNAPKSNLEREATPWDSILVRQIQQDGAAPTYTTPATLQFLLPQYLLQPNREYTYTVEAVVTKGGHETLIPVKLSSGNRFTTTKINPVVHYREMFLVGDEAQFLGVWVEDPQNTIQNNGLVQIKMSQGASLLQMQTVTAYSGATDLMEKDEYDELVSNGTIETVDLTFSGLSQGVSYLLEFVAPVYNETNQYSGIETDKVLKYFDVVGGSELMGDLNLSGLDYTDPDDPDTFTATVDITGQDKSGYLFQEGECKTMYVQVYWSDSMELPSYEAYGSLWSKELTATPNDPKKVQYRLLDDDGSDGIQLVLTGLTPNDGWKVELYTYYQPENENDKLVLDTIEFRTNGAYETVESHSELAAALDRGEKNILVTKDFPTEEHLNTRSVNGTVDFQGHIVKKQEDHPYTFLAVGANAKVTNLVFDYPETGDYINTASIFSTIHGVVENLIVRTYGRVELQTDRQGLIYQTIQASGVVRNFIVQLGGDLVINTIGSHIGGLGYDHYGLMENGYVYAMRTLPDGEEILRPGGFVIARGGVDGISLTSGLARNGSSIRNVFINLDTWITPDHSNNAMFIYYYSSGVNVENVYAVGDYYEYSETTSDRYNSPSEYQRMLRGGDLSAYRNIWCIPTRSYKNSVGSVTMGSIAQLHDVSWQKSLLGSAPFDVENTVPMGYFPRLDLPTKMQQYQQYVEMPDVITTSQVPRVVEDCWAEEIPYLVEEASSRYNVTLSHNLSSGYICLTFENFGNAQITGLKLAGLKTIQSTDILLQGPRPDSRLYDVVVKVEAQGYLSRYDVTEITYLSGTSTVVNTPVTTYKTRNIEFWKVVDDLEDWMAINDSNYSSTNYLDTMAWNYLVTDSFGFDGQGANVVALDRPNATSNAQRYFRGKLVGRQNEDGQYPVLRNISLTNTTQPYVIYYLASGSEVRNLYFENVTITAQENVGSASTGIIANGSSCTIENVRIRDAHITGQGNLGILGGSIGSSIVRDCSVVNSTLDDVRGGHKLRAGGLIGSGSSTDFQRCYTQYVDITIDETSVADGVGGMTYGTGIGGFRDCYTHGSITANASNVGGMVACDSPKATRCWSYVDIYQGTGNNAGGLMSTFANSSWYHSIALGDVETVGNKAGRTGIGGSTVNYAYLGQLVTGLQEGVFNTNMGEKGIALSLDQLKQKDTWQDTVQLGENYDYSPVDRNCIPKLISGPTNEGWEQAEIPLPGTVARAGLSVDEATYSVVNGKPTYTVKATLTHPGVSKNALYELTNAEGSVMTDEQGNALTKSFSTIVRENIIEGTGSFDGIDCGELAVQTGDATVLVSPGAGTDDNITVIEITAHTFTKAMDAYRLDVRYPTTTIAKTESEFAVVQFMQNNAVHINYWDIPDYATWHEVTVVNNHGRTSENFRITGIVDFEQTKSSVGGLILNRLEGQKDANNNPTSGFAGLIYHGGDTGQPWIEIVYGSVKDLSFEDMVFRYDTATQSRGMTGPIQSAAGAANLVIENVDIRINPNTRTNVGFIGYLTGAADTIKMSYVTLQEMQPGGTNGRYAGAFAGYSLGAVSNVTADHIQVDLPYCEDTGGIVGRGYVNNITLTGLKVRGYNRTGGIISDSMLNNQHNLEVYGVEEGGWNTVTGLRAGGIKSYYTTGNNWIAKDLVVTGSKNAGGIGAYSDYGDSFTNALVENCVVKSNEYAAGLTVGLSVSATNCQVVDCYIEVTSTKDFATTIGAGGIAARCTGGTSKGVLVKGCTIISPYNAGGAVGVANSVSTGPKLYGVYVDAATTVTAGKYSSDGALAANGTNAGGLVGYSIAMTIYDSASGALVRAGENAGGLVGQVNLELDEVKTQIHNSYYKGTVMATTSHAGGFIGEVNSAMAKMNGTLVAGCFTAPTVYAPEIASAWINTSVNAGAAGEAADIAVLDTATVNGTTINAILQATPEGTVSTAVPRKADGSSNLVTVDQLKNTAYYEGRSFTNWVVTHVTAGQYLPYAAKVSTTPITALDGILDENGAVDCEPIAMPQAAPTSATGLTVYISGVDTVNIEGAPNQVVTLGTADPATTLTLNENGLGAVPLPTGTGAPMVTVDSQPYALSYRTVMAYQDCWFFIDPADPTTIKYGNDAGYLGALTVEGKTPVHLWQGKVLMSDGCQYSVNIIRTENSDGTVTYNAMLTGGTQNTATTRMPSPIWESGGVKVYHNFTLDGTSRIENYRIFSHNGRVQWFERSQTVYDGILLTGTKTLTYCGYLAPDGTLVALSEDIKLPTTTDISQISNTLGYTGSIVAIKQSSGAVTLWNFVKGQPLSLTASADASLGALVDYIAEGVVGFFSFSSEEEDAFGFNETQQLQSQMVANGFLAAASPLVTEFDGELTAETEETKQTEQAPASQGIAQVLTGRSDEVGEVAQLTGTDGSIPGTSGGNGGGGGGASGSANSSGSGDGETAPEVSGEALADGDAEPEGDGTLRDSLGDSVVAFVPETGRYELLDTDSVLAGEPKKVAMPEPVETTVMEMPQEEPQSTFRIRDIINLILYSSERQGFLFIGLSALAAGLGLVLMILYAINKRNSK